MSRIVLLTLACTAALAAAQYSTPSSLSCGVGELPDNCPNSCYEPVCGDNGQQLCATILSCDAPKCVCDREKGFARDPSSDKCVKRADCPAWTTNPCMLAKCSAGHVCVAKNGKAECVKQPTIEPYPVTLNACAATSCLVGSICVEENGVGKCVAPPGSENNNCTVRFEEWKQCASCEPTCENKIPFCNRMCQPPRCQCQHGFFRNKDGQCVTENDCDTAAMTPPTPLTCTRKNEEYRECASACEASCKNKDKEMMCIAMCKPPACQCKVGFFRADNGECVTARACIRNRDPSSAQCKKNEAFASCSSMCEAKCGQYEPMACIEMCGPPKCQCTSGFFRNPKGECVSRKECDKTPSKPVCKKNQIYSECSSVCIPKCGEYEVRPCMAMCGPPKCECDRGFYLDNHGECVTRKECEAQSATPKTPSQADCNPNEKFNECSSMCEEKCGEALTRACPASCGPPKCQCDIGFLRNSVGDCVQKSDCDLDTPLTCDNIDCVSSFVCKMVNGKPTCVAGNNVTCAGIECDVGHHCEVLGAPQCIPDITCANIDCRSGMICTMKNGEPTCVNKEKLTCNTVKCAGGTRCLIDEEGNPSCIPMVTCANVRCAGPCTDTASGPQCGPRPLILPISVGPTSPPEKLTCNTVKCAGGNRCEISPEGKPTCVPMITCANVRCAGPCTDTDTGPVCGSRPTPTPETCNTVECASGKHCLLDPEGKPSCVPKLTCANFRCAGPCTDTPTGPHCGPRPTPTPDCPSNEEIRACTNKCNEPFCGDENFARRCAQVCLTPECECIEGFVRDRVKGCVKREDCTKKEDEEEACGVNEERKTCGNPCMEPFCGDEVAGLDINCINTSTVCHPNVCECKEGYVRDRANAGKRCIRREQCPSELSPCARRNCGIAMRCVEENGKAKCVPLFPTCGANEELKTCGNPCMEQFCGDELVDLNCSIAAVCQPSACECKKGFVRDRASNKKCIKREQCKPSSPCSTKNCGIAATCIDLNGRAKCVPLFQIQNKPRVAAFSVAASPRSKAATASLSTFYPFPSNPDSCDQVKCLNGGVCVMEQVKCVSGPCKPVPTCKGGASESADVAPSVDTDVPSEGYGSVYQPFADNCGQLKCKRGEECTMERIPCFAPPCKKGAVCRPANAICHKEHEVWDQCFHGCGPTCQQRDQFCTEQCGPGGCTCDTFYIRDEVSGNCVRLEDCPSSRAIPIEKPRILKPPRGPAWYPALPADLNDVPIAPVPPPPTCENFECPDGQKCILPPMACSSPPCTPRPECVSENNYVRRDEVVPTCEGHRCPRGQKCVLNEVQCIRAPCYPIPDCVIDMVPPTCNQPCPYGMTCVLETVLCKKAPCPQRPSCRLLQVDLPPSTCAAVTCLFGETCVEEPLPCYAAPCPNRAICRRNSQTCKKKNEIYSQCFTGCEASCQTRNQACTMQCGPGGCQCNTGYIRNKLTGECVREQDCPRGQKTCDGVFCRRDTQCEMRRGVPVCIRRPASDHPIPMGTMPPTVTCATLGCQPGEKCVQKSYGPQCEKANCAANEEYDRCFHGCEATCEDSHPFCTKQCGPGGCRCASGFVRDTTTSRCIEQESCPRILYV